MKPTIISRCIKRICPAVTVSGYEITARSVQYSMGLGLHLQLSLTSSEITISWIQRKETSNLRTSSPAVTVSGYEITARSVQYSMGLGLQLCNFCCWNIIIIFWFTVDSSSLEIRSRMNHELSHGLHQRILWINHQPPCGYKR